jgi:hypothetical protein
MEVKMKHNFFSEAELIKTLKKDVKEAAFSGVDKAAMASLLELRSSLLEQVKQMQDRSSQTGKQVNPNNKKPDMPKYRVDIISHLFGKDYADLEIFKSSTRNNFPTQFGKGFYIINEGRFETAMSIQAGWKPEDYKRQFKNSLENSLFVDPSSGQILLMDLSAFDGVKFKCEYKGRDEDQRLNNAVKNGETHIIVSAYKANFERAMTKAVPIGTVADMILEGKFSQAKDVLSKLSHIPTAKSALEKIDDIKNGTLTDASEDFVALTNTIKLIKNIRIEKKVRNNTIDYLLVSTFNEQGASFEALFQQLQSQISLWLINTQEKLVQEIIKSITAAIEKYGSAK